MASSDSGRENVPVLESWWQNGMTLAGTALIGLFASNSRQIFDFAFSTRGANLLVTTSEAVWEGVQISILCSWEAAKTFMMLASRLLVLPVPAGPVKIAGGRTVESVG